MRIVGGVVLLIVATAVGLFGPFAFLVTGLDWTFSKPDSVLEDSPQWDAERLWHVQFGVAALVVWLLLAVGGYLVLFHGRARKRPVLASVMTGASALIVLGATAVALSSPHRF
jgi:hypothetical protein